MSAADGRAEIPAADGRADAPNSVLPTLFEARLSLLLLVTVVAALFGQPNALFVYLPAYPLLVTALILTLLAALFYSKLKYGKLETKHFSLPRANLIVPTLLFFVYSLFSLAYAPDAFYGARILFSAFFKFFLFFALVAVVNRKEIFSRILFVISLLGGIFALQGLIYVVGFVFFNLQPGDFISSASGYGAYGYNPAINSLGILGFAKTTNQIGSFRLPRCQAMFLEPGFFATFLELSIFTTLGWAALTGRRAQRPARWLLGLQFGALLFTFSSAGWLAIGAGLLVYTGIRLFSRFGVLRRSRIALLLKGGAAVFGAAIVLGLCFPSLAVNLYNSVYVAKFASDTTEQTSAGDRAAKAADSIALFAQKPIFGWGSNQTPIVSAGGNSVGNAFLTVSTELGAVGLVIYTAMVGAIFWTLIGIVSSSYRLQNTAYQGLTAALAGGFAASFIHTLFVDTEWQFSYWIGIALIYSGRTLLRGSVTPAPTALPAHTPSN